MTKMNNHELKSIKAGADPTMVYCVDYLVGRGWDYHEAVDFCEDLLAEEE